jgi:hypothetical protein
MPTGINRRSVAFGLGTVGALAAFKGCGGGGSSAGGDGGGSGSLSGSIWYGGRDGVLMVPGGGTGAQKLVVPYIQDTAKPQISRKSPRYLQLANSIRGSGALLQVYDHGSNQPYCYINVPGYVVEAFVSPSGNFIAMTRSPDLVNVPSGGDRFGIEDIVGLNIADISDPNNPTLIRSELQRGPSTALRFAWLDGDQFLYMTNDLSMVLGSAAAGIQGDRKVGTLSAPGSVVNFFDVHPDGSTMLVTLTRQTDGSFDNYLYKMSGELIDKMTDTGKGTVPLWSPDGKYFMFAYGQVGTCTGSCPVAICETHYAPSSGRNVTRSAAPQLDSAIVPCAIQRFWSSIV